MLRRPRYVGRAPDVGEGRRKGPDLDSIVACRDGVNVALARRRSSLHVFHWIRWMYAIECGEHEVHMCDAGLAVKIESRVRYGWKGEPQLLQS